MAYLYATPGYLERIGRPSTLEELAERAQVIGFDDTVAMREGLASLGLKLPNESLPVRTENHVVQWSLCKQGVGLCAMMQEVGEEEPLVERVLPDSLSGLVYPNWLSVHRELRTSRRIRTVFDRLGAQVARSLRPVAA